MFDIVKASPEGIASSAIVERVFSTKLYAADDIYTSPHRVVAVTKARINKKLANIGLQIKATGGPGSRYYLVRL